MMIHIRSIAHPGKGTCGTRSSTHIVHPDVFVAIARYAVRPSLLLCQKCIDKHNRTHPDAKDFLRS